MATPSRFNKVGLQGRTGTESNTQDTYLKTFEFPVTAVASAAAQDTGIAVPTGGFQAVSAFLIVKTAEATALAKTVSVGTTVDGQALNANTDVSAVGPVGTTATGATAGGGTFTYTLAGADFAELDAVCVVTLLAYDA